MPSSDTYFKKGHDKGFKKGRHPGKEFKKGEHNGKEFEKGFTPWNKGEHPNYVQNENHPLWKGGVSKLDKYAQSLRLKKQEELAGRKKPIICEICSKKRIIHFDHDHKTGKFRGWICSYCNSVLGFSEDNVDTLSKIIEYLNKNNGKV